MDDKRGGQRLLLAGRRRRSGVRERARRPPACARRGHRSPTWAKPDSALDGDWINASPAVGDGLIYIGINRLASEIWAFDAVTGATRWRTGASVSNTVGSPMLAGSVLYAATTEDQVLALDAAAGARIWDAELNGGRGSGFYSWPTVAEGKFLHTGRCRRHGLYFGSRDGNGYALDAAIGAQRWQVQYGTNILASIQSSPAVVGGTVYIGTNNNGRVLALNAVTAPPCGVSARQARCWRVPAPADARRRAG